MMTMKDRVWWIIGFIITLAFTIFMMVMRDGEYLFEGIFILCLMLGAAPAIWARSRNADHKDDNSDKGEK